MKKRNLYKKELRCCDKTKYEVKKLKTEKKQLEKVIDELLMKISHYDDVLEITKEKKKEEKKVNKEDWLCHHCGRGYLKITRIYQKNGVFYIRICDNDNCNNKTKKQKWSKEVVGLE